MMNNNPALTDLETILAKAPVMGRFHPLIPFCLPEIEVGQDIETLIAELDDVRFHQERCILRIEN